MLAFKKWTGLFGKRTSGSYQTVQIRAPREYFKRADVFIDDVKYITKEELNGLNKAFLIKVLFDNFIEKIRHGEDLYDYLVHLIESYGAILDQAADTYDKRSTSVFKSSGFQWKLHAKNGTKDERGQLAISIPVHVSEMNRVEVFFDDVQWNHAPIDLELDELISLLFIEFITALRNGLAEETKEDIITFILHKWEERN